MKIDFVGRHFHPDDRTKDYAAEKLGKLGPFVEDPVEVRVLLDAEKKRKVAEVHVSHRFGSMVAAEESEVMLDAVNSAIEKIVKQARRSRKKFLDKRRRADRHVQEETRWPVAVIQAGSVGTGASSGPSIIRSSHIQIKPMTIDEAALSLETSKHDFVVFRDSGNEEVSVLYKRKDNNYGLIVPGS